MAILFEGNCNGKAVEVELGLDSNQRPRVRWSMEVVDGPNAGKRAAYSGKLDPDNIKYTRRDMVAIGWQGKSVTTFVDDVKRADKTVPFTAEIARYQREDGSVSEWTSARFAGAAKPLAALDREAAKKLDGWFASASEDAPNGNVPF